MTATLTVNGQRVELHDDGVGLAGIAEIDGQLCRVFLTVTPTGPRVLSPPKWMATT